MTDSENRSGEPPVSVDKTPDWGQHLQIVFSVLISVSFARAFTVLGETHFSLDQLALIGTVFYVVFDCWFSLNIDLLYVHFKHGWQITIYLSALVAYACIPFLYLAHTASGSYFGPPEFLGANLALVCLLDAVRRTMVLTQDNNRSKDSKDASSTRTSPTKAELWKTKNDYLLISGYAYTFMLILITVLFTSQHDYLSKDFRAFAVMLFWLIVRAIDHTAIDRLHKRQHNSPSTTS